MNNTVRNQKPVPLILLVFNCIFASLLVSLLKANI